ncbi:MAG: FKBP-type peptidyl-prolyl cis-trans isomerase [Phocaeicola sp.]
MAKKEEYKRRNEEFLEQIRSEEGVKALSDGILYKVIKSGDGNGNTPRLNSIVTVHYKGNLINGKEFDNSFKRQFPETFRLYEVITGWQLALKQMRIGDRWIIYIPCDKGYGKRSSGSIPAFSTLIFEVELLGIA